MYSRTKTLLFIEHYCIINKIGNFSEYQKPPVISVSLILPEVSRKADDGTRTRDLLTTNEVRYHLCHISIFSSSCEPHIEYHGTGNLSIIRLYFFLYISHLKNPLKFLSPSVYFFCHQFSAAAVGYGIFSGNLTLPVKS